MREGMQYLSFGVFNVCIYACTGVRMQEQTTKTGAGDEGKRVVEEVEEGNSTPVT